MMRYKGKNSRKRVPFVDDKMPYQIMRRLIQSNVLVDLVESNIVDVSTIIRGF